MEERLMVKRDDGRETDGGREDGRETDGEEIDEERLMVKR